MKRFDSTIARAAFALCFAGLLAATHTSRADDLAPPPWPRLGAPNYTVSLEWEFFASGPTPYVADGTEIPLIEGDGMPGGVPSDMLPSGDIGWVPYDGDGAWQAGINGIGDGALNFRVSNWIDTEPLKIIRVQITYDRGTTSANPFINFVIANDSLDPDPIETFIGATDGPVPLDPTGRFHRVETWEVTPNPDFESIQILVPDGVLVDQVVIDTISTVPEPGSLALLGLGGLLLARRRR